MRVWATAAAIALGSVSPASAVEVTGGEIELGYSQFFSDSDGSRGMLRGQVEFGFNPNFSLQLDLGSYEYDNTNLDTGGNFVAHANLHPTETSAIGLHLGADEIDGSTATLYGLEGGFDLGNEVNAQAFLTGISGSGSNGFMYGLEFAADFTEKFGASVGADRLSIDSDIGSLTKLKLAVDYSFVPQATVYAEIGTMHADAFGFDGDESYFGLGLKINLGPRLGTTFGYRSIFEIVPGG